MSNPNSGFDEKTLYELASAVMDGTADESRRRELTELLRASPAARDEYLAFVDLHATLSTEITNTSSANESVSEQARVRQRHNWIPIAAAAALAASLLVAAIWLREGGSDNGSDSFATIAQGTDVVWDSDQIEIGNRIGPVTLKLKSGLVRLEFDSGVEVTLEGPAVFKLVDVARTELKAGLLTATVPPGEEGFTVDTPSAQVTDLGTSFGIDLSNDGFESVSVFDGEVEIAAGKTTERETSKRRLLVEGESVRIGTDYEVEDIRFDPSPFEKMWPFASGIVGSTETIQFVPPWPRKIRFVQSDDQIFVRPEGHRVQLEAQLQVNISTPGECDKLEALSPKVIEPQETVRSYILHFSPETQLSPRNAMRVSGSITFEHSVLGVIVCHEELLASSHRFGRRRAGEGNQRRELSLTGDEAGDRIALSDDRKTISLDLISPGRSSDLVRVIVGCPRDQRERRRHRN